MSDIKVICDRDELVNIANSVRRKSNISKEMSLDEIAEEINNISGGSGGGEDVTAETNAYTTKLASLETAITALETELAGKASGGSGGIETVEVDIKIAEPGMEIIYIDGAMMLQQQSVVQGVVYHVVKNSIFVVANMMDPTLITNATYIIGNGMYRVFFAIG